MALNNSGGTICFYRPKRITTPIVISSCSYLAESIFLNFINKDITTLESDLSLNTSVYLRHTKTLDITNTSSDEMLDFSEMIIDSIKGLTFKTYDFASKELLDEYSFTATEEDLSTLKSSFTLTSMGATTILRSNMINKNGHDYFINAQILNHPLDGLTYCALIYWHSTLISEKSVNINEICFDLKTFTPIITTNGSDETHTLETAIQGDIKVCDKIGNYATLRRVSTLG